MISKNRHIDCPQCNGTEKVPAPDSLAGRFKNLRASRRLSLMDVKRATGISTAVYCRIESGKNLEPVPKTLIAASKFFGVSVDYFLGLENNPDRNGDKDEKPPTS